jgi:tRNA-dihydrouridine synthase 3
MGSGLMIRKRPLEIIARTMAAILSRPLTIKMRTGVFKDKNIAHTIFPHMEELGVRKGGAHFKYHVLSGGTIVVDPVPRSDPQA